MPLPPEQPLQLSQPAPVDPEEPTPEEADQLAAALQQQADQWRARLADPQVQEQVKRKAMSVNPLVLELMQAFPPQQSGQQASPAPTPQQPPSKPPSVPGRMPSEAVSPPT